MDTDWIFQGEIDSEQKNYVLLSYFQKLNKDLEQIKMYPMFTELSLHLGNLQTLLNRNQILYIDKKLKTNGDEIYLSDLKVKDIPQMTVEEFAEYQKILRDSHTKIFDYFNIAKALWYPMFTELSLHLGNLQTLLNRNQILYIDKKLKTNGDEIYLSDLKVKDIPQMTVEEFAEYQKILRDSHTKIFDYFNIAKALWSVAYDSIDIRVKRNRKNLHIKNGFFYTEINNQIHIWSYKISKIQKTINQTKITTKLLYKGNGDDLTIIQLISKFSKTYKDKKEKDCPIFEIICNQIFPLSETLLPIFKRKVSTIINQTVRDKKLLENGVQ